MKKGIQVIVLSMLTSSSLVAYTGLPARMLGLRWLESDTGQPYNAVQAAQKDSFICRAKMNHTWYVGTTQNNQCITHEGSGAVQSHDDFQVLINTTNVPLTWLDEDVAGYPVVIEPYGGEMDPMKEKNICKLVLPDGNNMVGPFRRDDCTYFMNGKKFHANKYTLLGFGYNPAKNESAQDQDMIKETKKNVHTVQMYSDPAAIEGLRWVEVVKDMKVINAVTFDGSEIARMSVNGMWVPGYRDSNSRLLTVLDGQPITYNAHYQVLSNQGGVSLAWVKAIDGVPGNAIAGGFFKKHGAHLDVMICRVYFGPLSKIKRGVWKSKYTHIGYFDPSEEAAYVNIKGKAEIIKDLNRIQVLTVKISKYE